MLLMRVHNWLAIECRLTSVQQPVRRSDDMAATFLRDPQIISHI